MADHFPARRAVVSARRALVAAGLLAAVVLAGCGTPGPTSPPDGGSGSGTPTQGASASASQDPSSTDPSSASPVAPARSVTAANLLTTENIYLDPSYQTAVEKPEGVGRTTSQSYVCLPDDGLASLGATAMVTRNFGYKVTDKEMDPYPKSPLKNQPIIYTQALQLPDAAAAAAARARYVSWIKACPKTLVQKGYSVDTGQSLKATALHIDGAKADAGMVAYVKPGDTNADLLYWESVAVTQVKDRLMITVALSWGEDTPGTFDTTDGDFIHPQVILAEESALKLAV
jgi:hypothetical protein